MSEQDKCCGAYAKYTGTRRTDGRDQPGEKHHNCPLFILDIKHDKFAIDALKAYAHASRYEYPQLSADILKMLDGVQPAGWDQPRPEMPEEEPWA